MNKLVLILWLLLPTVLLAQNQMPKGNFDGVNAGQLFGWAYDPDTPSASTTITLSIDGIVVWNTATDVVRPDVNAAFMITGSHGFAFTIPVLYQDGKPHSASVAVTDLTSTARVELPGSPKTFTLAAAPTPTPINSQGLFILTNVAPGTVDTIPPVITNVTYGASVPADGATLASTATRFEFRVTASDNMTVAYATLELLKNITDDEGELIQFKRGYLGPLTPTFVLTWDEKLVAGTYYVRIRVYDLLHNKAERVITVKK